MQHVTIVMLCERADEVKVMMSVQTQLMWQLVAEHCNRRT